MIRDSVAEIIKDHVVLEIEGIDRMYLNGYVPSLQTGAGFAYFLRNQLDCRVPSTFMIAPMSKEFVAAIERFVETEGVELVSLTKGERKDDVAREHLTKFQGLEGILFVGKAQEKANIFRTEMGLPHGSYSANQMSHDLRRLRFHGLIKRVPHSHRYRLTRQGAVTALFYVRFYARALRPGLSLNIFSTTDIRKRTALKNVEQAVANLLEKVHLAA